MIYFWIVNLIVICLVAFTLGPWMTILVALISLWIMSKVGD